MKSGPLTTAVHSIAIVYLSTVRLGSVDNDLVDVCNRRRRVCAMTHPGERTKSFRDGGEGAERKGG